MEEKITNDPVIVLGIPRSGTSTVARILAEQMNFLMALEYAPPDWRNPGGFYEDISLISLNESFLNRGRKKRIYYSEWRIEFLQFMDCLYEEAIKQNKNWGFKETRAIFPPVFGTIVEQYADPIFVYCKRDYDLTIVSLQKCFDYEYDVATLIYDERAIVIERILKGKNPIIIDYKDKKLADAEIKDILVKGLNERN